MPSGPGLEAKQMPYVLMGGNSAEAESRRCEDALFSTAYEALSCRVDEKKNDGKV
jgi:hypothetical protein